jgi:hypothetical protein
VLILQRPNQRLLDCAILPMPVDAELYNVQQIAQSPLFVCMRSEDSLANEALLDIHKVADRIKIFRDPELHPSAHSRLVEMFSDVGIQLRLANSARAPSDIQWMVKAGSHCQSHVTPNLDSEKQQFRRFGSIPSSKKTLWLLALQFAPAMLTKRPIVLQTEELGGKAFHGRTVIPRVQLK